MRSRAAEWCLAALVALAIHCGDGAIPPDAATDAAMDAAPDASAVRDGAVDASSDGEVDASPQLDGSPDSSPEPDWCDPFFYDTPQLHLIAWGNDRADLEYEITVVSATETGFAAKEDPDAPDIGQYHIEIELPEPLDGRYRLPTEGETIVTLGGSCGGTWETAYLRVMDLDRNVLWEGGNPSCGDLSPWWGPYLGARWIPGAEICDEDLTAGRCCCVTREPVETILHADGDSVLVRGETREVEIKGARFDAFAYGEYFFRDAPDGCTFDNTGFRGTAFLARLAD